MTALGIAVIGLGVGAAHARAYAAEGCAVHWLYDLERGRAEALAAELGQGAAAESYEQLLADPRVDVVSIASFDDAHFAQVRAALLAGKHVFVEKPLCRSQAELEELSAIVRERPGLRLSSNLVLRGAPLYRWLRDRRAAGELGRVYAFDGDYLYGRLHKITDGWRRDVVDYSVMLGGGVHLVDLMLWVTGERPDSVRTVGNCISTEGTDFRYLDFAAATFRFPSGLVGRITANFGSVHAHQHVVRVFGTRATVLYDDDGPRIHESRDPAVPVRRLELVALPESKGVLVPAFVRSILRPGDTDGGSQHEFDLISVCAAADRSLSTDEEITIRYV